KTVTRLVALARAPSSVSVALNSHRQMPAATNQPCATSSPTDAVSSEPTMVNPFGVNPSRPRKTAGASAKPRLRCLSSFTFNLYPGDPKGPKPFRWVPRLGDGVPPFGLEGLTFTPGSACPPRALRAQNGHAASRARLRGARGLPRSTRALRPRPSASRSGVLWPAPRVACSHAFPDYPASGTPRQLAPQNSA